MNLAIRLRQQDHRRKEKKNRKEKNNKITSKRKVGRARHIQLHPKILMHLALFPQPSEVYNLQQQLTLFRTITERNDNEFLADFYKSKCINKNGVPASCIIS